MEQRKLGRIDHMSSILTFGGAALWNADQAEADAAIEMALEEGVNPVSYTHLTLPTN